jgi:hypothetical protein
LRFPVLGEYSNVYKALAGGAHATAHDYSTGHALLMIAKPGFWLSLGSSLSLKLTFLKPAQVGNILLLEAEVRKNRMLVVQRKVGDLTNQSSRDHTSHLEASDPSWSFTPRGRWGHREYKRAGEKQYRQTTIETIDRLAELGIYSAVDDKSPNEIV